MTGGRSWDAGSVPWVQRALDGSAWGSSGYAQCYFCGDMSVKLSVGDLSADHGRVEVYCDNGDCDAREMTTIVTRDGHHSDRRADVRMLDAIDADNHTTEVRPLVVKSLSEIAQSEDSAGALARRTSRDAASYSSPAR